MLRGMPRYFAAADSEPFLSKAKLINFNSNSETTWENFPSRSFSSISEILLVCRTSSKTGADCVRPGKIKLFDNYYPTPLKYEVRTEVKQNDDCSGETLTDVNRKVQAGENAVISDDGHGHYFLD